MRSRGGESPTVSERSIATAPIALADFAASDVPVQEESQPAGPPVAEQEADAAGEGIGNPPEAEQEAAGAPEAEQEAAGSPVELEQEAEADLPPPDDEESQMPQ